MEVNLTHKLGCFAAAVCRFNILYILRGLKNNTEQSFSRLDLKVTCFIASYLFSILKSLTQSFLLQKPVHVFCSHSLPFSVVFWLCCLFLRQMAFKICHELTIYSFPNNAWSSNYSFDWYWKKLMVPQNNLLWSWSLIPKCLHLKAHDVMHELQIFPSALSQLTHYHSLGLMRCFHSLSLMRCFCNSLWLDFPFLLFWKK